MLRVVAQLGEHLKRVRSVQLVVPARVCTRVQRLVVLLTVRCR